MKKRSITSMLVLLSIALTARPLETPSTLPFITANLEHTQALASNQGKLYFIYFSASWCMPCQWMEENTFSNIQLKEYITNNYLSVKIDLDDEEGETYRQNYQIKALPTILIFNSQGQLLQKCEEALPPSKLLTIFQSHDQTVNKLIVAVPIPPPVVEKALPKEDLVMHSTPPMPTVAEEIIRPALLPDTPPVLARPIVTPTKEYGNLPQDEPALPPLIESMNEVFSPSNRAFGVQLGAFSQAENARRMITRLEPEINAPLEIYAVQQNGQKIHKVIAGAFSERSEALSLLNQLKQRSIKGFLQILD